MVEHRLSRSRLRPDDIGTGWSRKKKNGPWSALTVLHPSLSINDVLANGRRREFRFFQPHFPSRSRLRNDMIDSDNHADKPEAAYLCCSVGVLLLLLLLSSFRFCRFDRGTKRKRGWTDLFCCAPS